MGSADPDFFRNGEHNLAWDRRKHPIIDQRFQGGEHHGAARFVIQMT
ncbi:Uncharacterised protein [Klebsiella pneumoniae]|nr:Uncharacterised protein [Klebsiella pneumoniae]